MKESTVSKILPVDRTRAEKIIHKHFETRREVIFGKNPGIECKWTKQAESRAAKHLGIDKLRAKVTHLESEKAELDKAIEQLETLIEEKSCCDRRQCRKDMEELTKEILPAVRAADPVGKQLDKLNQQEAKLYADLLCIENREDLTTLLSRLT